jgi:polyhydroxyalkanoate synthase
VAASPLAVAPAAAPVWDDAFDALFDGAWAMDDPDKSKNERLSQIDAAPQRSAAASLAGRVRARGPHPLPVFLASIAAACGQDQARLEKVLAGLNRYQAAPPAMPRRQCPVVAEAGPVTLRDHGAAAGGRPVVLVPSLINPPDVLDLAPGNSLAAALAAAGLRPLIIDWGAPEPIGLDAIIADRLVPIIAGLGEPVPLLGYCLGGTLALAAATLLGPKVSRLALLAAPWHFGGYGDQTRAGLAAWWASTAPLAAHLGVVPMDLLQPAFWSLDPQGLADKYARFGTASEIDEAFVRLEDWSNGGAPLSIAAMRDLAETLFADDASGRSRWTIAGERIAPAALACPILDVIAGRDRIVPPAAALSANGPGTPLRLDAGHVGMVVGSRAPMLLWQPLTRWLNG